MPKQRVQVDSGISPAGLKPVASPVDSFVQTSEGKQLEQLAKGLAQLSPALGRFSDTIAKRDAEENFAAGQRKARDLAQSAKDFKAAIQAGTITPGQSPWFMAGLHEQFGRLAADRMNFEMLTAAAQDETLQSTVNPSDFDKFVQTFTQQWQDNNLQGTDRNAHFEQGFGSKVDAYIADAQRQFAAELSGRVIRVSGDAHFSEVMSTVMTEWGRHTTPETIGAALTELNDAAVARGLGGNLVNQRTVDAVVSAAKRSNDTSMLALLDHIQSGKDSRGNRPALSTTRYGADAMDKAESDIAAENQARNNRDYESQQHARSLASEQLIGNAVALLEASSNPHSVDLKTIRDQMAIVSPDKVNLLYQLQDAWSDRTLSDEPLQVASAFRRIYTPHEGERATSLEDAAALLAHRQISIPTYQSLLNEIQQRDASGGASVFERDSLFKASQRQMRAMFVSEFGGDTPDKRQRAEDAVDEFSMRYIRWRQGAGKDAPETEARQFLHDTRLEVFRAKSGVSEVRDFDAIPHANLGPQPPDPKKMLVTDPTNISMLEGELAEVLAHTRNGFSTQALSVLQYIGIPPTLDDVTEFLKQQRRFVPSFIAPDSTRQN